jgi:hypothetical protein
MNDILPVKFSKTEHHFNKLIIEKDIKYLNKRCNIFIFGF